MRLRNKWRLPAKLGYELNPSLSSWQRICLLRFFSNPENQNDEIYVLLFLFIIVDVYIRSSNHVNKRNLILEKDTTTIPYMAPCVWCESFMSHIITWLHWHFDLSLLHISNECCCLNSRIRKWMNMEPASQHYYIKWTKMREVRCHIHSY